MKGYITARRLASCFDGGHAETEARVEILDLYDTLILVVADGVGGDVGGGAAQKTLDIARKAVRGERPNDEAQIWAERLAGIDRMLSRDKNVGETTAVVAAVSTGRIVGASAGDSGAWLITDEGIEDLTRRQSRKPYLGSGAALPVPFETAFTGGTLLLGTDDLFNYAEREHIADTVRGSDLEQAADALLELVRLPGGTFQDDVGLLLCRRENKPTDAPSLRKAVGKLLNWGRRG